MIYYGNFSQFIHCIGLSNPDGSAMTISSIHLNTSWRLLMMFFWLVNPIPFKGVLTKQQFVTGKKFSLENGYLSGFWGGGRINSEIPILLSSFMKDIYDWAFVTMGWMAWIRSMVIRSSSSRNKQSFCWVVSENKLRFKEALINLWDRWIIKKPSICV